MKPQKSQRVCVLSVARTHTVVRTIAIAPFFGEVYYLDVANVASSEDFNGTKVIHKRPFGSKSSRFLGIFKLLRYFKQLQPDLIICYFTVGPMYLAALLYNRCPVVGVSMGSDVFYERGDRKVPTLERLLRRMCLRETTMIIAKSHALMVRIREFGVTCPIFVNYWGCDVKRFTPGPQNEARLKLDLSLDHFIILSPRAISPLYSIDMIFEAFKLALTEIPTMHLMVIGRTPKEHSDYISSLDMFIKENGLENSVSFIGIVDRDRVPDYIRAADIVVTAARTEGFPNTVFETMSCGSPVVAVDLPQFHELLTDGENIVLCERSVSDLAGKLVWLSQSPDVLDELVKGGNQIVAQYANIEKNAREFASRLDEVLPKQNSTLSIHRAFCLLSVYLISQFLNRFERYIFILRWKS